MHSRAEEKLTLDLRKNWTVPLPSLWIQYQKPTRAAITAQGL